MDEAHLHGLQGIRWLASATGGRIPSDSEFEGADRPVINVDWSDARAYAGWLAR